MEKHSFKHSPEALSKKEWVIFQRSGTQNWSVRFSLPGQGQIRESLKTADEAEAHRRAAKTYYAALARAEAGLEARAKTVTQVIEEYVKAKSPKDTHAAYLRRYVADFCGRKEASHLTTKTLSNFIPWRKTYWITGPGKDCDFITYMRAGKRISRPVQRVAPSDATLYGEMIVLKKFLTYCRDFGYIVAIPVLDRIKPKDNARPSFSTPEIETLMATAYRRILEAQPHPRVRYDRTMLYAFIGIMVGTGMRPTEAQKLKWGDVLGFDANSPYEGQKVTLRVSGKNKHRAFIPQDSILTDLGLIWGIQSTIWGRPPNPSDYVFADEQAQHVKSFSGGLNALLEACHLKKDYRGADRTAYSFRHYHITHMLNMNVPIYKLAKNCGTSVDMIERFYSHVTLEGIRDDLRIKTSSF
ncbi:tyrosine-type recombinase/integrase [Komagataeibacter medellinensis]|uniref:Phage DNA recombinase n=1 Tax=Komagataeibacter medellinensis (strain NBRC 3288 / BCRC 11682 / LMG 1693 / Kondo 51) TaxID=634177 RepID=G2I6V5_KOMMN|nr:tyrosine-type recombinase/integrase [Komagataeibacter medellinensis]BAK83852.1 phage DNA recombinase [Komagataeibacter medellinensis NBRC 3288]